MKRVLLSVCVAGSVAFGFEVPRIAPKPLKETQDPAQVQAHAEAVKRAAETNPAPVMSPEWVKQIQDFARTKSHRESIPIEHCTFVLEKDGSLARFQIIIPTNAARTPNDAYQNHNICSAEFDAKKGGKLQLSDEKKVEGPDLREVFGIDQLPTVSQELSALRKFQQGFTAKGLKYTLEAFVILAPDEKSWIWEVGPSEEQQPNIIYGIYYYPIMGELRTISIDNAKVKQKVEAAAKAAGFHITYVKSMDDR